MLVYKVHSHVYGSTRSIRGVFKNTFYYIIIEAGNVIYSDQLWAGLITSRLLQGQSDGVLETFVASGLWPESRSILG